MADAHNSSPPVVVEEHGRVAVLRIDRPARRNSLSASVLSEMENTLAALCVREDIGAFVFTGTGDAFASGANIEELAELSPADASEFALRGQRLFQTIADAPQLTVAAVNGFCMGGGLDLALACDVRYASPAAVFAHPGLRLGVITGWGGTQRLPRVVGAARALEMMLTGRRVSCKEALEMGLVRFVAPDVLAAAIEFCRSLPPDARKAPGR
jgi:enoyl-CoA hydratase